MFTKKIASCLSSVFSSRRTRLFSALVALSLCACLLTSFVVLKLNTVTVVEGGKQIASFTTIQSEQQKLLEQAGVTVGKDDVVTYKTDKQNIVLEIERAFAVSVQCGDEKIAVFMTSGATVEDVLAKSGVVYGKGDTVTPAADTEVEADMNIVVVHRTTKTIKETESIAFKEQTKKSDKLYIGETKVEQQGKKGEKTSTFRVVYEDGKEISRTLVSSVVTKEPQDKITLIGTKKKAITPPSYFGAKMSKEQLSGAKCITVTATAYCNTSDGGQVTVTGQKTGYGVIAVDPRVIPLGSKLYVESPDGSYVYGYCVAGDTGGAIKGNRIDLFLGSESECRAFGRRSMKVYIIG